MYKNCYCYRKGAEEGFELLKLDAKTSGLDASSTLPRRFLGAGMLLTKLMNCENITFCIDVHNLSSILTWPTQTKNVHSSSNGSAMAAP
jgi:hypothetical protein